MDTEERINMGGSSVVSQAGDWAKKVSVAQAKSKAKKSFKGRTPKYEEHPWKETTWHQQAENKLETVLNLQGILSIFYFYCHSSFSATALESIHPSCRHVWDCEWVTGGRGAFHAPWAHGSFWHHQSHYQDFWNSCAIWTWVVLFLCVFAIVANN